MVTMSKPNMNFACSWHSLHVNVARDGNVNDNSGLSILAHGYVRALIASISGSFKGLQDDRVGVEWILFCLLRQFCCFIVVHITVLCLRLGFQCTTVLYFLF